MHADHARDPDSGAFVVLGAAGGIGSAVVRALASHGQPLLVAGRTKAKLSTLELPAGSAAFEVEATDFGQVQSCLDAARELGGGRILGVAHCIGSILLKPAHATSEADWHAVLAQNLTSAFAVVRAAGKAMREGGAVVLCSTAAARTGLANHEAIAAAKAGVEGLVRSAAATYAARGLRFNAVAPGLTRTPLARAVVDNPRSLEQSERMHPLGRVGEPEDVASAIAWLLDPANDWITGEVLAVDGGLANARPVPRA
ncbi:MAG: SDR family oxidoreductase [Planctomycetota bacterium]